MCMYKSEDGICKYWSSASVKDYCHDGPCPIEYLAKRRRKEIRMNIVEAISWFENRMKNTTMHGARAMFSMALSALREQQERENPKPLTLNELLEMRYGWVWVISNDPDLTVSGWAYVSETGAITVWEYKPDSIVGNVQLRWEDYGKTWLAYRHKQKEV